MSIVAVWWWLEQEKKMSEERINKVYDEREEYEYALLEAENEGLAPKVKAETKVLIEKHGTEVRDEDGAR